MKRACQRGKTIGLALAAFVFGAGVAAAGPTNDQERTVSVLDQAVKTDPNNADLWLHLGFAYRKVNQIDQAQSAFEKAASLDPRNTDAFFMLGLIYESKHQNQAAAKAWKDYLGIEKDPGKRAMAENHLHRLSQ